MMFWWSFLWRLSRRQSPPWLLAVSPEAHGYRRANAHAPKARPFPIYRYPRTFSRTPSLVR